MIGGGVAEASCVRSSCRCLSWYRFDEQMAFAGWVQGLVSSATSRELIVDRIQASRALLGMLSMNGLPIFLAPHLPTRSGAVVAAWTGSS